MNNVIDRLNTVTEENTKSLLDAAYLAQTQNTQLIQGWVNTMVANQEATRAVATRLVKNAQETQSLFFQMAQDLVRSNTEAMTKVSEMQFRNVNATIDNVGQNVKNGTKIETPGSIK